jgi:leucyl-tRNA---protein transferase
MFGQVESPETLTHQMLDEYLLKGWFRMGQNIFTTNFLNFKGQFYSAIWLRVRLAGYEKDSTEVKLRKLNSKFTVDIRKASITSEKEMLFLKYRGHISFEASASLHQLMYGKASHNVFDTFEVTIRDGEKLVACGFFDLGEHSAAGITSFYDPDYKKHSLGKYLIYLKIAFCHENGFSFFYPGYFVPGYSFFDYKLTIGKRYLEYLELKSGKWFDIAEFSPLLTPIRIMHDKLNHLQILLAQAKMDSQLYKYEFFEANLLPELKDVGLFDFPLFLHFPSRFDALGQEEISVVVYDVCDQRYHVMQCRSLWHSNLQNGNGMFSAELLKEDRSLLTSRSAEEVVSAILFNVA